jgi:hypothetical protein
MGNIFGKLSGTSFRNTLKNRIFGASVTSGAPVGSNFRASGAFEIGGWGEAEESLADLQQH